MKHKILLLSLTVVTVLSSCKKETAELQDKKDFKVSKNNKFIAKVNPGGSTNFIVRDGNQYLGYWGGATLTFTQILYPTDAVQGQLCGGLMVSTDTGEISESNGMLFLILPSFVAASGSPIQDWAKYSDAIDKYFKSGGSMPQWDSYVSATYGPAKALGCFVIVDFNSPSGFSLVSTNNASIKGPNY